MQEELGDREGSRKWECWQAHSTLPGGSKMAPTRLRLVFDSAQLDFRYLQKKHRHSVLKFNSLRRNSTTQGAYATPKR